LVLADGQVFEGEALGASGEALGEVVFNTALTGYQEILSDPSYAGQIITLTYPEIGNYGVNDADDESPRVYASGLVVREAAEEASSWRAEQTLDAYLKDRGVVAIAGVDTRRLVRHITAKGAQMAVIATDPSDSNEALAARAAAAPGMEGRDLASEVSTEAPYTWIPRAEAPERALPEGGAPYKVVAYDFGVKRNILDLLWASGCDVTVVPAHSSVEEVMALSPEGVFLSNGPGDPAAVEGADQRTLALMERLPVFGICLGCQIMGRALGAQTYKLAFGHHGANHPVKDLTTERVEITSQNHGFAVDPDSLPEGVEVTHRNLNDGTVEGIASSRFEAFAVQYHPEAAPGPHDSRYLFERFTALMAARRGGGSA